MARRLSLVLLLASLGCAGEVARMDRDLRALRERVEELSRANAGSRARVQDLESRLLLLQDEIETQRLNAMRGAAPRPDPVAPPAPAPAAPRPGTATVALPVVKVVPPRERAEEPVATDDERPAPAAPAERASVEDPAYQDLDDQGRVVAAKGRKPAPAREPAPPRKAPRAAAKAAPVEADDATILAGYRAAHELYEQGRVDDAIGAFREFVKRYPTHPYADNAQYWVGECLYDRKDWEGARREFLKVVKEHPDGNKVPDAMVKVGLCSRKLQQFDEARRMFDAVMLTYPESPAATVAMKLVAELP